MLIDDITIEVRNRQLERTHMVMPDYWTDVKVLPKLRRKGTWSLSLPAELDACAALRQRGAGIIITGPAGVLTSGPVETSNHQQTTADPVGMITFTGVDDNCLLGDYTGYPDPANPADSQTAAYDSRSGPAESVIRGYVNDNLGPGALAARREDLFAEFLQLQTDGARGATVYGNARFDQLGPFLDKLGKLGGIAYRIVQVDDHLELEFWEPADKTKLIRLDIANDGLTATNYTLGAPSITRGIVLGQGEGADRQVIEGTSVDAAAAEAAWGRRIEGVKDQRNTNVTGELEQAVAEMLLDGGRTHLVTKVTPSDNTNQRYQVDWKMGDLVTTVIGPDEVPEIVTAVGLGISKEGVVIGAIVGEQ